MANTTKNRPVSREERALTAAQAREVAAASPWCVLSTADAAGVPYGVPVTPVLVGDSVYFHSTARPASRRRENLEANPEVSLCFVGKANPLPERYSVDYASAVITGLASLVTEETERLAAMRAILARHAPGNDPEADAKTLENGMGYTQIWKVHITGITGKARCGAEKWRPGVSLRTVER